MVGDIDNRLLTFITNKLHLILSRQNGLRLTLLAGSVPDTHLDSTRVPLLSILAAILEQEGVTAMALNSMRAIEDTLSPTSRASVQGIGAVILIELILASIEDIYVAIFDAVGDASDRGAIVRGVVLDVVVLRGEAENDILPADAELLNNRAEGQEGEFCLFGGGHCVLCVMDGWCECVGDYKG